MGGAVEERDGVATGDIEGERAIEDDALRVEARGDVRGGEGKWVKVDDKALGGGVVEVME